MVIPAPEAFTIHPIGIARTPFQDKASAPRQPSLAADARGTVELFPGRGFEDALDGLAAFDTIWLLFLFHEAHGFSPKVQPPRSRKKLGVFATRSPHRPNPVGMSAVRLERIEGLTLHVRGLDLVDGTPIVDIKPYIPYTDAVPDASSGWLGAAADPGPRWAVDFGDLAREQLAWLREHGVDLGATVEAVLSTGPEPHAYRRIRKLAEGSLLLAVKSWRFRAEVEGHVIRVLDVSSGYKAAVLATPRSGEDPEVPLHRAFGAAFERHAR